MYDAAEAGLYQILVNVKCCKRDKGCEVCDSIRELREEQEVDAILHQRKSKSKAKAPAAGAGHVGVRPIGVRPIGRGPSCSSAPQGMRTLPL